MPKEGYYSLTISEEAANILKEEAAKKGLGLVEYFEQLTKSFNQIRIGESLELSSMGSLLCYEIFEPIEEVQQISSDAVSFLTGGVTASKTWKHHLKKDGISDEEVKLIGKYNQIERNAHLLSMYSLDAIRVIKPDFDSESVKRRAESEVRQLRTLEENAMVRVEDISYFHWSDSKIAELVQRILFSYDKLKEIFDRDERLSKFIKLVDPLIVELRQLV
jgi:hypothetical protein